MQAVERNEDSNKTGARSGWEAGRPELAHPGESLDFHPVYLLCHTMRAVPPDPHLTQSEDEAQRTE